jgi:ATP-dependent RNA helicase DeaD
VTFEGNRGSLGLYYEIGEQVSEITTFSSLKISEPVLKVLGEMGYKSPTEIQEKAIPVLLDSKQNFVGQAQTGTGKTAAFVIPLLEKIDFSSNNVSALILAPTRELAQQVEKEIGKLGKYTDVRTACIYGGTEYEPQMKALKVNRPHIVVGTPGRVIDMIKKRILKVDNANSFILDEADEMLNMGFFEDVEFIMTKLKKDIQLMMFSATMPKPIVKMINKSFNEHVMVNIKKESLSNADIEQKYFIVREKHFKEGLSRLIDNISDLYAIVFCRTKIETREVGDDLKKRGHTVEVLNGDMGQIERDLAMSNFKKKRVNILVCTDVAARGIDVINLTHVFNYGLPRDNESYVHRIGRTGRAGLKGSAYTIAAPKSNFEIANLEAHIKTKIEKSVLPSIAVLKENLVKKDIENAQQILSAILAKGADFKTEESFSLFEKEFGELSKEDLLKLMFVWKFNKEIRRYNNLEDIETVKSTGKSRKDRPKPNRKGPKANRFKR